MALRSRTFVNRLRRAVVRGSLPVWILEELEGGPTYGYELLTRLSRHHGGPEAFGPSTVYPVLARLRLAGLVNVFHGTESLGPLRKYYELTTEGRTVLPEIRHLGLGRPGVVPGSAPRGTRGSADA